MARWRVEIIRGRLEHLGTVTAPTENLAITRGAEQFHIPLSRRNRIVVTKISEQHDD
jgi:hypothetical protein